MESKITETKEQSSKSEEDSKIHNSAPHSSTKSNGKRKKKMKIASEETYGTENLWKLLLRVTGPTVIMLLFVGMYNVTDALIASWLIPQNWGLDYATTQADAIMIANPGMAYEEAYNLALSAVNPAIVAAGAYNSNIMYIVIAIVTTINVGAEIKYAKLLSHGKHDEAKQLLNTSFSSTLLLSFIIFFIFMGTTPGLVKMLDNNQSDLAMQQATKYTQVELFWIFFYTLSDLMIRFLRVEGHAGKASILGSIALPVNLVLDMVFMGLLGLPLVGAGYASIVAEGLTFFMLLGFVIYLRSKDKTNMLDAKTEFKPNKALLVAAVAIGAPVLIRSIVQTANSITITTFATRLTVPSSVESSMEVNGLDPATFYSASVAVYTELYALLFAVMTGVVQGSGSVIAFNYHQKKYDRVKDATLITLLYMVIWVGVIQVIFQTQINVFFDLWSMSPAWPVEGEQFASLLLMRSLFVGISYTVFGYYVATDKLWESYLIMFIQNILVFYIVVPIFFAVFAGVDGGQVWFALSMTFSEIIVILMLIPFSIREYLRLSKTPDGTEYPDDPIYELIPDSVRTWWQKMKTR